MDCVTSDGRTLAATLYEAPDPRAVLVVFSALGVAQRYYDRFATHLAAQGIAVLTVDFRGCGASADRPHRQDPATLSDWAQRDAPAVLALARARFPGLRLVALGHSFGGQCLGLLPPGTPLDAAVVIAAGSADFSIYPPHLARRYRLQLAGLPIIAAIFGYIPGWTGLGADLPRGVVTEWARWCHTPGYARGALPAAQVHYDTLAVPMLFLEVEDDTLAPSAAAAELRSWYTAADRRHEVVRPKDLGLAAIGHFGVLRMPEVAAVWDRIGAWVRGA